jgi:hypothetical protein
VKAVLESLEVRWGLPAVQAALDAHRARMKARAADA